MKGLLYVIVLKVLQKLVMAQLLDGMARVCYKYVRFY